ncbi:MAG: methyltransferase domain-containing protein [Chlamydiales bacterium]|nr:methyltransferase domain-containing protein [Chlamydiales bacterium]
MFAWISGVLFSMVLGCGLQGQEVSEDLEKIIQQSVAQGYHEDFIELVEMIYGEGFLSQGGENFVEQIVEGVDLSGKTVLDIGSGLGGPDLYLAKNHSADITGLEPQKWLFERAVNNLERACGSLKGSLRFVLMEHPASLKPFGNGDFDIVMSKETVLHVPMEVKRPFFSEIYRVLKPGGEIVIMDWMHRDQNWSCRMKRMMKIDGVAYHLMTPDSYKGLLEEIGFKEIRMENVSKRTALFSQANIDKIGTLKGVIEERYGMETFDYCVESWGCQRDLFLSGELIAVIFRAKK